MTRVDPGRAGANARPMRSVCFVVAFGTMIVAGCGNDAPSPDSPADAARVGREIIGRAIAEAGSISELGANGFLIAGTGTIDERAEGQAFVPGEPAPGPFRERLVFDFAQQRFAREYREDRYDGTFEHLSEIHTSDSMLITVVHSHGFAIPTREPQNARARQALLRRLPHALLAEVSRDGATPRWLGTENGTARVAALLETGTPVTLAFAETDGLLRALTYDTILPALGRISLSWTWEDWRIIDGFGRFPFRYAASTGDYSWLDVFVDSVAAAENADFDVPARVRTVPIRIDSATTTRTRPIAFTRFANGVFTVANVRAGFTPIVIERSDHVVAVDAPASFPLLGAIPVAETDPGPNPSWVSERFADAITHQFPNKPVRFLILTHAHHDHAGGVRAFVALGATVIGPATIRPEVERILQLPADAMHDRLAASPQPLRFLEVNDSLLLDDSRQPIRLLDIRPNPHSDGLLAVHLTSPRILFVSDLVTPASLDVYPRAAHAALDFAFLRWFDATALAEVRILTMHGTGELTPEHVARLRSLAAKRDSAASG
ncbi:MAG: MBL fold metallo-hydrolase [Longimicrobiales bacterium]